MKYSLFFILIFFSYQTLVSAQDQQHSIMKRSEWGWQPTDSVGTVQKITKITIHHGGETFPADKDVVQYLKNLQKWSRETKHWLDNPYHYLIDPNGNIYEGRPDSLAGDTNTSYDPTGHLLIVALGNFEEIEVPKVQYEALIWLTKEMAKKYQVPINSKTIRTHKDYAVGETVCPGEHLYKFFLDGSFMNRLKTKN